MIGSVCAAGTAWAESVADAAGAATRAPGRAAGRGALLLALVARKAALLIMPDDEAGVARATGKGSTYELAGMPPPPPPPTPISEPDKSPRLTMLAATAASLVELSVD